MRGKAEIQYRDKFRKPRLDGVETQARRVAFGVGNFRRVVLVIRAVMGLDLERRPLVLALGLGLGELIHVGAGTRKTMVEAIDRSTMAALSATGLAKGPPNQAPNCEPMPLCKKAMANEVTRTLPPPDGQIA